MKRNRIALVGLLSIILMISVVGIMPAAASPIVTSRTYTLDADFDEGTLIGVEHETVHDQLQLSQEQVTLPFIWVPNDGEGTVSKVDTETGNELGRYHVAPYSNCRPSRTTVDLDGSCWVGVRQAGTVVKIGLYEIGEWIDRNDDGICQTSQDLNDDGDITGAEMLPWGEDECVLYEVVLIPSSEGTYAPGTYTGTYDTNYWGTAPRGLAIDSDNNLWAGTWISSKYYYIDGETGAILRTIDVYPHSAYGAVIDANGILWSSGSSLAQVLRLDPSTDPPVMNLYSLPHYSYGLGVDTLNHLFVSGWTSSQLSRFDVTTGVKEWTKTFNPYIYQGRGVACTGDNDVWVASTAHGRVARFDNDGTFKTWISVGNGPTGVAVDAAGKVWAVNVNDDTIARIDPATNTVDLTKHILGSGGHYGYSDMTGIIARTITTKIGTWTVNFDSEGEDTPWGKVSWNSLEPEGTSVTVRVRSSNDESTWSDWEDAANDVYLTDIPDGRYLQIETTLKLEEGEVSPILYDLTVEVGYIPVHIDIKPGSWPNPLNRKSKGVIPVAICGTPEFDVYTIDPASVRLTMEGVEDGVAPLRWSYEDVATPFIGDPYYGHDLNGDGIVDLCLKFDTQELVAVLGLDVFGKEPITIILTGFLKEEAGGIPILGQDYMVIRQ
ncbi:MAG: hypothetical protein ACFFFD_14290 [Promethearchaeota archaeon]